jgi:putative heme-binding domain-containing protein
MAASLQELTDKSGDATLNPDPARYGAEPMTAARFKKELAQLMDAIVEKASAAAPGSTRVPRVGSGVPPERTSSDAPATPRAPGSGDAAEVRDGGTPSPARETRALPGVRFVLLSPIRHEDLRATRPGLPDPAEHNKLLAEYSKAIEELAKERGARFVDLFKLMTEAQKNGAAFEEAFERNTASNFTDNGIHISKRGYSLFSGVTGMALGWDVVTRWLGTKDRRPTREEIQERLLKEKALRAAIIRKNELFFHRWRPANWTYIFGFRKGEQGRNAKEMPMFDPLIAEVEAEIDRLKRASLKPAEKRPGDAAGKVTATTEPVSVPAAPTDAPAPLPLPKFTVADGYQIELWAENPMLEKPTQMNWDALGRLWICSSSLYPQIAPGQQADDKILILSDPAGSGKATKSEVFARGLLIPTGVVPDLAIGRSGDLAIASKESAPSPIQSPNRQIAKSPNPYGCYVGQSTELLHIDPTGKKRIVLSGFGTEDTHHIIHTLRWGPDGRLYFNQSIYIHSHLETPWGMVRLNSGGCLAYDPRTERTEVFAKGWINSWGHAWDRWGQSFFTDGAGGAGINWAFPGATFVTYERARQIVPSVSPGNYPKFCGLEILYSPHFPADWQGNAITCDFRAHRIVRFGITDLAVPGRVGVPPAGEGVPPSRTSAAGAPAGPDAGAAAQDRSGRMPEPAGGTPTLPGAKSGYMAKQMPDIVRTDDASFRPIDVKMGPDGALYVADWSNPIINHGEVDFRDPRRDHHSGRIWRISKKDTPVVKWEPLVGKKTGELLEKLLSESGWEKEQAKRALIARMKEADFEAAVPEWAGWTRFRGVVPAETRQNLEGMLLAQSLGIRNRSIGVAMQLLTNVIDLSPAAYPPGAQALAARILTPLPGEGSPPSQIEAATMATNPRVRLEAMRALARIPTARSAELILDAAMKNNGDVFLNHAAWLSINELAKPWTDAIASGAWKSEGREAQLDFGLKALPADFSRATLARVLGEGKVNLAQGPWIQLIGQSGGPDDLRRLYEMLLVSYGTVCCPDKDVETLTAAPVNDTDALRILAALLESARVRNTRPAGDLAKLERLVKHTEGAVRAASVRLVGLWKPDDALRWLETALTTDGAPPEPAFVQNAIESVRDLGGAPAIALLRKLAADKAPAPRRQQAAAALAALDLRGSLPEIAAAISAAPSEDAALAAWRDVFKIKGAVETVTARLSTDAWGKALAKPALAAGLRAAREAGKKGEKLVAEFTALAGLADTAGKAPADFAAIVEQVKKHGNPARGELVYRRATSGCVTCHAIGNAGGTVGPAMTSLGASAPLDYIVESIYAPSAKIKEGYDAVTLSLKDGTEITGIDTRETERERFLRNVAGQEIAVVKTNIASRAYLGSLMPAGLLDQYPEQDRWDLLAFLGELGKPGPYDASKPQVARVWRIYPGTAKDAALKGAPSEATANALTLVDGRLLKEHLTEALQLVTKPGEKVWAVTQFQTATAGPIRIGLDGATGALLDGKSVQAVAGEDRAGAGATLQADLPAGLHTLAVELDVRALPATLRAAGTDASFVTN